MRAINIIVRVRGACNAMHARACPPLCQVQRCTCACVVSAAMVRRLHIKVRGLDPPEHQLIRPCTWLKFTLKYHAWFEIRNSKFEIMNRPGDPVLAKFRSLRPAEKALLSLIYILSAMTKCGPKPVFLGPIGWGTVPHWIGPKKRVLVQISI